MTAQEMFEKLGFEEICHDDREIIYFMHINDVKVREVEFDLQNKTFYCMCSDIVMEVDMELLKSINQQCKELGWLDETVL